MPWRRRAVSTRYFTWLHTPKTGGTWTHRFLTTHAAPEWEMVAGDPAHVALHELPSALAASGLLERVDLPVLAGVRDPWSWYLSYYFFVATHLQNCTGEFILPHSKRKQEFRFWTEHLLYGCSVEGFRRALPLIIDAVQNERVLVPQHSFLRDHRSRLAVRPILFESLADSLLSAVEETGAPVSDQFRGQLKLAATNTVNATPHPSVKEAYTRPLVQQVARAERWLLDHVSYDPPSL